MTSRELEIALALSKQRSAILRLLSGGANFLPADCAFKSVIDSFKLDASLRQILSQRRPLEAGTLVVTQSRDDFDDQLNTFFRNRHSEHFELLLAHWLDAGAMVVTGDSMVGHSLTLLEFDGDSIYGRTVHSHEVISIDRSVQGSMVEYELFYFPDAQTTSG